MKDIHKGSLGCAIGVSVMLSSVILCLIIFWKCFSQAYHDTERDYTIVQCVSAGVYRDALFLYLLAGLIFFGGLWIAINAGISVLKSFFDI